ncbi:MAG: glycosyltransferase, partial [Synergistales bacterium]|nr:glycosyltransferase [Synergistales bacterium]
MFLDKKIAVVIPCFKVSNHINNVIQEIPEFVDHIIVVDDACPEKSGNIALKEDNSRVTVIFHKKNQGVGGATISGLK